MYSLLNTHHIKAPGRYLARNKFYEHTSSPSSPCICGREEKYSRSFPRGKARQQLGGNGRPLAPERGGCGSERRAHAPRPERARLRPGSPRAPLPPPAGPPALGLSRSFALRDAPSGPCRRVPDGPGRQTVAHGLGPGKGWCARVPADLQARSLRPGWGWGVGRALRPSLRSREKWCQSNAAPHRLPAALAWRLRGSKCERAGRRTRAPGRLGAPLHELSPSPTPAGWPCHTAGVPGYAALAPQSLPSAYPDVCAAKAPCSQTSSLLLQGRQSRCSPREVGV